MADYNISLGIELDTTNLATQIRNVRPSENIRVGVILDDESIQRQITNIRTQIQQLGNIRINLGGNIGGNNGIGNIGRNIANNMTQVTASINNVDNAVYRLQGALRHLNFNDASIALATQQLEHMDIAVERVQHRIRGNNLRLNVTGIDDVGRAVTILRDINLTTGEITNESRSVSQSFGRTREEIRQTSAAYREMRSLIKEIGNTSIRIDSARAAGQNFDALEQKLVTLNARYDELEANFAGGFDANQIRNLSNEWENVAHSINIANEAMANTATHNQMQAEARETAQAFSQLESVASRIDGINLRIKKLDANDNKNEIARLTSELSVLEQTYQNLRGELQGRLPDGQLASLTASAVETANKLKQLDAQIADTKARLAKKIEIKLATGKFTTQIDEINRSAGKLTNVPNELRERISELNMQLNGMQTAAAKGDIDGLIKSCKAYEVALEAVRNQLKQNKIVEQNAFDKVALEQSKKSLSLEMDNYLKSNSAAAAEFGAKIQQLKARIDACDATQLDGLKREFQTLKKEIQLAGKNTQTFGDQLKSQFEKYKSYISVATLVMWAVQGLKDMFRQVVAIDSAMTELKKVTDETDASYNNFLKNAASRAKELGTTIDGLVASTADFARLGYGFQDSQKLAEVANIYAVVGDEIEGVEDATQSLVSTMAAFKDEMNGVSNSDFALSIVDKMNEVSNNFSISSGGIGEALQRSASSMSAANNSLDETISLITAANEVVQSPEKVGNALKTVSMRIRSAKTEMEEMGEDTTGMVESTAQLRAEIKALSGVDIMASATEFKSTYAIMDELSKKWKDLTDIQQASIIELMAGKHQGNVFASLMQNFDTAREALETSMGSAGSAMAEHAKWSESLEANGLPRHLEINVIEYI